MFSKKHSVLKFNAIAVISLLTTACGGGGSSASLPSRAVDNIAPFITTFFPANGQFPTSVSISVTFSEAVSVIKSNNITITQFDSNRQNPESLALPDNILVLDSTQNNTVLDINFANATTILLENKIYLVKISGIQDRADIRNTMFGTCSWYFATNPAIVLQEFIDTAKCDTQANIASSNWDELIWDRDNWN